MRVKAVDNQRGRAKARKPVPAESWIDVNIQRIPWRIGDVGPKAKRDAEDFAKWAQERGYETHTSTK